MDVRTPERPIPRIRLAAAPPRATVLTALASAVALIALSLAVSPLPAHALPTRPCKGEMTGSTGLRIVKIKVTGAVKCSTAKVVARRADKAMAAKAKEKVTVHDRSGRAWRCRITQHATGTDPGYIPYTSVRCERGQRLVRFKLAS